MKTSKEILEKTVKEEINNILNELWPDGWFFMPVQSGRGKSGIPDHLGIVPVLITPQMVGKIYGMGIGIEAKRFGKEPTTLQYGELASIVKASGFAVYCAGLEGLVPLREKLRKRFCLT